MSQRADNSRRPYKNVKATANGRRWEAYQPLNSSTKYLGTYDTPEAARQAVLLAQAEHLESKAQRYRNEAAELEE